MNDLDFILFYALIDLMIFLDRNKLNNLDDRQRDTLNNLREVDFFIDITEARSIGVSGLDQYLDLKAIGRLSYAKPDKVLKWLK